MKQSQSHSVTWFTRNPSSRIQSSCFTVVSVMRQSTFIDAIVREVMNSSGSKQSLPKNLFSKFKLRPNAIVSSGLSDLTDEVSKPTSKSATDAGSENLPAAVPEVALAPPTTQADLTPDQAEALKQIEGAFEGGGMFLLTGHAGTGKTYLMQRLTRSMLEHHRSIVLTAPTHKAVGVLARKLFEAGIDGVPCRTIHSLLSLKGKEQADRLVFERSRHAEAVTANVVVIDECSLVDLELYRHIKRHLPNAYVVFVGDPAQLPPVGELESQAFA